MFITPLLDVVLYLYPLKDRFDTTSWDGGFVNWIIRITFILLEDLYNTILGLNNVLKTWIFFWLSEECDKGFFDQLWWLDTDL